MNETERAIAAREKQSRAAYAKRSNKPERAPQTEEAPPEPKGKKS